VPLGVCRQSESRTNERKIPFKRSAISLQPAALKVALANLKVAKNLVPGNITFQSEMEVPPELFSRTQL